VIDCTRCGFSNEDSATFCRSCGGFLEWSGARVKEPEVVAEPPPVAAEVPEEEDVAPGVVKRVRERIGGGGVNRGHGGLSDGPTVAGGLDSANGSGLVHAPADITETVVAPKSDAENEKAEPESRQPDPTEVEKIPEARHPAAVLPQTVAPRPQAKSAPPPEDVQVGDLICGQCGAGNVPTRRFCRRCAASLEDAVVFRQSRWQRFLQRRRQRKVRPAGSRPGVSRHGVKRPGWISSWVTKVLVVVVVLFALAASVGPFSKTIRSHLSGWSHDVSSFIHPSYTPVHPVSATASSVTFGHQASLAIDGESNTSWETADGNNGVGQSITINFTKPVNLNQIGFLNGDQNSSQSYLSESRPQLVHLVFNGSPTTSQDITLADVSSFQTFKVSAHDTTKVVLSIISSYQSPLGHNAAIAEIEFFSKEY
jgi:ribosomal protein L40E